MEKDLKIKLDLCKKELLANKLKKGKIWKGYNVYVPFYKSEYISGLPKIVLVKNNDVRISSYEECFAYMNYAKSKKQKL